MSRLIITVSLAWHLTISVRNHTSSGWSISRRKSHQRVMRDYKFPISGFTFLECLSWASACSSQLIVTTKENFFFRLLRLALINQINWFVCFFASPLLSMDPDLLAKTMECNVTAAPECVLIQSVSDWLTINQHSPSFGLPRIFNL